MKAALAGLLALAFCAGCLRFGYDTTRQVDVPDASHRDAGVTYDAAVADAAPPGPAAGSGSAYSGAGTGGGAYSAAGKGGKAGAAGQAAGTSGAAAGSSGGGGSPALQDAGTVPDAAADSGTDPLLGDSGLSLSEVLGFYETDFFSGGSWGAMVLRRYGTEVIGVYQYNEGTVVGEITGDGAFVGWWSQLPTREGFDAGEVEFRFSKNSSGIAFDGRWRWGTSGNWYENWDANKITDRAAPAELNAAFDNVATFTRHP